MATIYFTASSLDGYIVDEHDSLDWLTSRKIDVDGPFGYEAFINTVGALVMGSATYEWVVKNQPGEWMYEQPSWVLTHRPHIIIQGHPVQAFDGDVADLHPKLVSAAAGKDVWVVGGGEVAAQFVAAGLIDEMIVTYTPCSLGGGSPVLPVRSEWVLAESGVNGDFVCARWRKA
ncbi:MAG TPA: dihydrofolate reductase family protein [Mycobacterium sp.]